MIINYLRLTIRLLLRNPVFAFINLACLSIGFAMFFMLWEHAQRELHTDQYHKDFDRIVRPEFDWNWTDDGSTWQHADYGTIGKRGTDDFMNDFGDFDDALELYEQGIFESKVFGHRNDVYITRMDANDERTRFVETHIAYADSNLFNFFSIPLIRGNSKSVLKGLRSTVLSKSTANKYFGSDDPVGKVMYLNDSLPLTITGVFDDLPSNTHLKFDLVISTFNLGLDKTQDFQFAHGYLKLKPGVTIASLRSKLDQLTERIFGPMLKARNGNLRIVMNLKPLKDVAFTAVSHDVSTAKSKYFLWIIRILAFVILGMAWINYINLSRANNERRLKELGARKTVGATTTDLIKQFLMESLVINLFAFLAALTLIQIMRGPAETFFQFHVVEWTKMSLSSWAIVLIAFITGVFITGVYPAWVTVKNSPKLLFGALKNNGRRSSVNSILTTAQYTCAIVLIAWVLSITLQLQYIFKKDVGIDRANIVIVDLHFKRNSNFPISLNYFMTKARASKAISDVTVSSSVVGDVFVNSIQLKRTPSATVDVPVDTNGGVDENFIPFFGIKLIAGRNFSLANAADRDAIILSRVGATRLGFLKPEDAVGITLEYPKLKVIGIIEDYAMRPLMSEYTSSIHGVRGIGLTFGSQLQHLKENKVAIKIRPGMTDEALTELKEIYSEVFTDAPFQSYFLDNHINQYYNGERIFLQQVFLFAGIAIFIACVGLLGMMRIKVLQYSREIAIRKVLGANTQQLGRRLLTSAFVQVVIAAMLALPISYYLDSGYLEKFSERITLGWWHYTLPFGIFVLLLGLTIAALILKATRSNPVDALYHE